METDPLPTPGEVGRRSTTRRSGPTPTYITSQQRAPKPCWATPQSPSTRATPAPRPSKGKFVKLPIVDRLIPIIEDDYVVMPTDESDPKAKYATGFLKVTPAHDPNDWDIGQRHNLPVINVMAPDASISGDHGWTPETDAARNFVGLSREDARKRVVQWFKDHGLLEEIKPYRHSVGHSYRSHVPVEPYLSDQWYVAVQKPIPWMPDDGTVEGTTVPKNSLAGLALTALAETRRVPLRPRPLRQRQPSTTGTPPCATGASAANSGGDTGFRCGVMPGGFERQHGGALGAQTLSKHRRFG